MGGEKSATARRAVVTGGAGFVGSHLVDRLIAEGTEVLVIDDLSTGRAGNLPAHVRLEQRDISKDALDPVMRSWRPHLVFHLAAQSSVPASVANPARDQAVNVVGTERVLGASRNAGVRRFTFVSSGGAIYGATSRAATERSRPKPASPYGVSKLRAEGLVAASGLDHTFIRPSNIYGPRQSAGLEGAVVATFVHEGRSDGSIAIHGDGLQTRDFIHVRDVIDALVVLGDRERATGAWNVSSGRATSILELAGIVEGAVGHALGRLWRDPRPGDVRTSAISSARLRSIGWSPAVGLAAGIGELVRDAET
jgi:UDP-glucose 4-epimerase